MHMLVNLLATVLKDSHGRLYKPLIEFTDRLNHKYKEILFYNNNNNTTRDHVTKNKISKHIYAQIEILIDIYSTNLVTKFF